MKEGGRPGLKLAGARPLSPAHCLQLALQHPWGTEGPGLLTAWRGWTMARQPGLGLGDGLESAAPCHQLGLNLGQQQAARAPQTAGLQVRWWVLSQIRCMAFLQGGGAACSPGRQDLSLQGFIISQAPGSPFTRCIGLSGASNRAAQGLSPGWPLACLGKLAGPWLSCEVLHLYGGVSWLPGSGCWRRGCSACAYVTTWYFFVGIYRLTEKPH